MTTMLFYQDPVVLNRDAHRNLRLKPATDGYTFAAGSNAIPLTSPEFVASCRDYAIVFVAGPEGTPGIPSVMAGLRDGENLFVNAAGVWDAEYIPAFVRRYPFLLHEQDSDGSSLIMIDQSYPGCNTEEGEPLFGEDGNPAPMLSQTMEFLQESALHVQATIEFMNRLEKYDLLIPHTIEVTSNDGKKFTMQGFSVVDEQRLAGLTDAQLVELVRSGDLGRIHAHLLSLNNVGKLTRLLEARLIAEAAKAA